MIPATVVHREGLPLRDALLVRLAVAAADGNPAVCGRVADLADVRPLTVLRFAAAGWQASFTREVLDRAHDRATAAGEPVEVLRAKSLWAGTALTLSPSWQDLLPDLLDRGHAGPIGEDTAVQQMAVTAGLAQLDRGDLEKASHVLDYLTNEHAGTPARWLIFACRTADHESRRGDTSRVEWLLSLPRPVLAELSHDDHVDLAELAYLHDVTPGTDLARMPLPGDRAGFRTTHTSPYRRRQSHRAFRVTRLRTALGSRRHEPAATDDAAALFATSAAEGDVWSGRALTPRTAGHLAELTRRHLDRLDDVVDAGSVEAAAGIELVDRVLRLSLRGGDGDECVRSVAEVFARWSTTSRSVTVFDVVALLLQYGLDAPDLGRAEPSEPALAVAYAEARDRAEGSSRCEALLDEWTREWQCRF